MAEGSQASDRSSAGNPLSDEDDMTHLDVEDMSLEAVPKSKIPVQSDDSSSYEKDSSVSYYDALPRDESRNPYNLRARNTRVRQHSYLSSSVSSSTERRNVIFDMRHTEATGSCGKSYIPGNRSYLSSHFSARGDSIIEVSVKSKTMSIFVIAAKRTDRYLLVQGEVTTRCTRLHPELTQQHIVQIAFPETNEHTSDEKFCFFVKDHRLERFDVLHLQASSEQVMTVKVVKIKAIRFSFVYRCGVFYEKHFIVKGKNTDCLSELKSKFLGRFLKNEHRHKVVHPDCVWFILNNRLVSEQVLQSALCTSFSKRLLIRDERLGAYGSKNNSLTMYVHFQAADAVPLKVHFKPDRKTSKIEMLTVISPSISETQLRLQLALVTEVEPEVIKIVFGKKKLNAKLDIQQALRDNSIVSVEVKQEITIEVEIFHLPESSGKATSISVCMYPYDRISKIKSEVCTKCRAMKENVDIFFGDKCLSDKMTASECRFKDTDSVKAYVFSERVCIRVRSASRRLYDVVIDDAGKTTVGDVKNFMHKIDSPTSAQHQFSTVAILDGRVLQDDEMLINTGICSKGKEAVLVFIHTDTICFTSSSSLNGKFVIFRDSGEGWFQLTLAMSDGKDLFYALEVSQTIEKILSLAKERNLTPSVLPSPVDGIQLLPPRQVTNRKKVERCRTQSCELTDLPPSPQWQGRCRHPSEATCLSHELENHGDRNNRIVDWSLGESETEAQITKQDNITDWPALQTDCTPGPQTSTPKTVRRSVSAGSLRGVAGDTRVSPARTLKFQHSVSDTFSENLRKFQDLPSNSDGEFASSKRRQFIHRSSTYQSLQEDADGKWTLRQISESETSLPAEAAQKQLACGTNWISTDDSKDRAKAYCSSLLQYLPDNTTSLGDSTFRYIKKTIIHEVSKKIARDGMKLCRHLGVLDETVEEAKEAHPLNLSEQNYYLLKCWCRSAAEKATAEALKTALRECQRNDLVALVDDLQVEPTTC